MGCKGRNIGGAMPSIVLNRAASMGDVICVEPCIRELHKAGWDSIYVRTLPIYQPVWANHPLVVPEPLPGHFVDLDNTYETRLDVLMVDTYLRRCGLDPDRV